MATSAEASVDVVATGWPECFAQACQWPAWRQMLDGGRRASIRHTRGETRTPMQWTLRDLVLDLDADLVRPLEQMRVKPRVLSLHADVVRIPKGQQLTLKGSVLLIAARRIEVEDHAQLTLDFRATQTGRVMLYTPELAGRLDVRAVFDDKEPQILPVAVPRAAGIWLRAVDHALVVQDMPTLPSEWFDGATPAWRVAVTAFQMAAVLMETQPDSAQRMLAHIVRRAGQAPADAGFGGQWQELARASTRLQATGAEGARIWALDYGRLLFRGTPGHERKRKADELERAQAAKSQAVPYELVGNTTPAPEPEHTRYIRHGAVPCGMGLRNGDVQPLRSVTLTGAEVVLDLGDKSQFLKLYGGKKNIQDLTIHADTLVVRTGLRFPQTRVTIFCRALYFEGPGAWIDTTPDPGKVWLESPMAADGLAGAEAGSITLHIERFGSDQAAARHFRAMGGTGQDPRDGGFMLDPSVRYLRPVTQADWSALFVHSNRVVGHQTFDEPKWDDFKADEIVYVELQVAGSVVATAGEKSEPGTGGAGIPAGRPGTGGRGGTLQSTVDEVFAYADVSGGASAAALGPSKGHIGGSPAAACWLFFENAAEGGIQVLKSRREIKKAVPGPDSVPGPDALEPQGEDGVCETLAAEAARQSWRTPLNLAVAVQFGRDALASGYPSLANEVLVPYLQDADALMTADQVSFAQLARQARDLAEQSLRNIDDFGNPPGWVPLLSLESTLDAYLAIVKPSMAELYTAYRLQRAWDAKAGRQAALEDFSKVLGAQTEATRGALAATRTSIFKLMDEFKSVLLDIDNTSKRLSEVETNIKRKNDTRFANEEGKRLLSETFKILGAVVKAIPLPEPYQAATAGLGVLFDTAGSFIGDDGKAFETLNKQIASFSAENSPSLAAAANSELAGALVRSGKEIEGLQAAATEAQASSRALSATHGAALSEHAQRAAEDLALYELKKKVLVEGRSSEVRKAVLVKEAESLHKNYEAEVKARQARLDARTTDLIEINRKKKELESDIQAKQKTEGEKKVLLAKKQADSEKSIKDGLKKVQTMVGSVESIKNSMDRLSVPRAKLDSEWDKALGRLQVEDEEFQAITRQLAHVNADKLRMASTLARLQADLTQQKNEIASNLVTIHGLSMQMSQAHDVLVPEVAVYVQALGQEAHRDLQRFLYYVVKAYEYQRAQPWGQPQHDAQKLFDDMRDVLVPSNLSYSFVNDKDGKARQEQLKQMLSDPAMARQDLLTEQEFDLLRVVYEKPLRDMGKALLDQLMLSGLSKDSKTGIQLRPAQLQALNTLMQQGEPVQVPFDLVSLRQVDGFKERQRITNVRVTKLRCRRASAELPTKLTFRFEQQGKSLVRADGRIYAFESEGAGSSGSGVCFETFGGSWRKEGEDLLLTSAELDQPAPSLERHLLAQLLAGDKDPNAPKLSQLSEFQPGALTEFTLTVVAAPAGAAVELLDVELVVTTEGTDAPRDEWLVCVTADVPGMVPIRISKPDRAGHLGGLGRYIGVFRRAGEAVEVSVEPEFGAFKHQGWLVDGKPVVEKSITVKKNTFLVARYASGGDSTL